MRDITVAFHPQLINMNMVLSVQTNVENIVGKLVAALHDGRLNRGPYDYIDGEFLHDDDGVAWVNAEVNLLDGRWCGVGADEETGELYIAVGLKYDELDGTVGPIIDPEAYWLELVQPLKKVLAILH